MVYIFFYMVSMFNAFGFLYFLAVLKMGFLSRETFCYKIYSFFWWDFVTTLSNLNFGWFFYCCCLFLGAFKDWKSLRLNWTNFATKVYFFTYFFTFFECLESFAILLSRLSTFFIFFSSFNPLVTPIKKVRKNKDRRTIIR